MIQNAFWKHLLEYAISPAQAHCTLCITLCASSAFIQNQNCFKYVIRVFLPCSGFFFFNYLSLLTSVYVPNIPFLIRVYRCCIILFKEKEIRVKNRCIEYALISKKTSLYSFQVALHPSHAPITLCRETSMSVLPVSGFADKAQSERPEEETTRCIFFSALLRVLQYSGGQTDILHLSAQSRRFSRKWERVEKRRIKIPLPCGG